jgi:thioredoxin-related protein
MRLGFILFCLFLTGFKLDAQVSTGINFRHGLPWSAIKEIARVENKYIFLDCYATWCAPCKRMDKEIYPVTEVANYANRNFVSVKVQLDTSAGDDDETRRWYEQAAAIGREFHVGAYPTFIFLSPEGDIVHKGIGFKEKDDFLMLLRDATDSTRQCYTLLKQFRNGNLAYGQMPSLALALRRIGDRKAVIEINTHYVNDFLLKLKDDSLYTKESITEVEAGLQNTRCAAFRWFYGHADKIDSIMGNGYSDVTIRPLIAKEEAIPILLKWDSLERETISDKDWNKLQAGIERKYNKSYADRIVLDSKLRWYSKRKVWKQLVPLNIEKLEKYGFDTSSLVGLTAANNVIYAVIFMHSSDKRTIGKAIAWMKIICAARPYEQDFLDTYANLLYKNGVTKEALALEQKAISLNSGNSKEISDNLEKMRQGKPTWSID